MGGCPPGDEISKSLPNWEVEIKRPVEVAPFHVSSSYFVNEVLNSIATKVHHNIGGVSTLYLFSDLNYYAFLVMSILMKHLVQLQSSTLTLTFVYFPVATF